MRALWALVAVPSSAGVLVALLRGVDAATAASAAAGAALLGLATTTLVAPKSLRVGVLASLASATSAALLATQLGFQQWLAVAAASASLVLLPAWPMIALAAGLVSAVAMPPLGLAALAAQLWTPAPRARDAWRVGALAVAALVPATIVEVALAPRLGFAIIAATLALVTRRPLSHVGVSDGARRAVLAVAAVLPAVAVLAMAAAHGPLLGEDQADVGATAANAALAGLAGLVAAVAALGLIVVLATASGARQVVVGTLLAPPLAAVLIGGGGLLALVWPATVGVAVALATLRAPRWRMLVPTASQDAP